LAAASWSGNEAVVKILLEQGAEINAQSGEYGNALAAAARNGHTEIVNMLLDKGANINVMSEIGNALMASIFRRKEGVTTLLLERGAETNVRSGQYTNALTAAAILHNIDAVCALLKANIEYVLFFEALEDSEFLSIVDQLRVVLPIAAWMGRLDIVKRTIEFINQGCRSSNYQREIDFRTLSDSRLKGGGSTKTEQYNGYTALHLSAAAGHPKVVATLLALGASVHETTIDNGRGRTALHIATERGHLEVVKVLLDAGANVNHVNNWFGDATALQEAAYFGRREVAKELLAYGANPNIKRKWTSKHSALLSAAKNGDLEIVTMLLEAGADVNATGFDGATPLHEAQQAGHLDVAALLLSAGAK